MQRMLRRPWIVVAVVGGLTAFFAVWLPRVEMDNNTFRFIPRSSATRMELEEADALFGSQTPILIGLHRTRGTVLDKDFLLTLRELTRRAGEFALVSEVISLVNADYIAGDAETIRVDPLVPDDFDGSADQIRVLRDRLLEWDVYGRALISDDFRSTQMVVALDVTSEEAGSGDTVRLYQDLKELAYGMGFADTVVYLTGLPAFASVINSAMRSDLIVLVPLVAAAILLVLFLSFRRAGGIVLPMLTVLVSAVWSVGAMAIVGVKLSIIATVLPVILVAVGSAYGIHVVSHYYDEIAAHTHLDREGHLAIIVASLRRIARPVFLAAVTTFAGFGSLCFTTVVPIREFGVFSSLGVLVAFGVSVTLIPALLVMRGPPKGRPAKNGSADDDAHLEADAVSRGIADFLMPIARRPVVVLAAAGAILIGGLAAARLVVLDNIIVEYFKPDTDIARSDAFIRSEFGGSKALSVVVRSQEPGGVLDPEVLGAMDRLETYLGREVPDVGKVTGYHQLIKRMNQIFSVDEPAEGWARSEIRPLEEAPADFGFDAGFGFSDLSAAADGETPVVAASPVAPGSPGLDQAGMAALLGRALAESGERNPEVSELMRQLYRQVNYRGTAYYEIPTDPQRYGKSTLEELKSLIGNYLVLLGGGTDPWADDPLEPSVIRMNVQVRTVGQRDTRRVVSAIHAFVDAEFPREVQVGIVGEALVEGELNDLVVRAQVTSLITSLAMVFLILLVNNRSAIAGLVGIVPLTLAIVLNFAVMGLTGITLNLGTALVASIGVGVGVDYTVHYLSAYHREWLLETPSERLLRRTFLTSGKAIIFNAASVAAGFAVLMLSRFNMMAFLGGLIAFTMGTSSLASLVVLPALLTVVKPKFIRRPLPYERNPA